MSRSIVAIEIGSSKIKGAIGELDPSGSLLIRGIEEVHQQPNFVSYGHVHNVREVANELKRVINALSGRLTSTSITGVYVAVGGRSLMSTPTLLEERLPGVTEVTPEIVERLLGRARTTTPDRDLLDVRPVEYKIDGKAQGTNPIGILGNELSAHVNLVTIRSQIIRNLQMAITDKLGLAINGFVVRPLAVSDLVMTDEERRLGAMLVDFGAETTTVAIYKKGSLQYLATIPLGSRHITRDLTALPYTEERAEEIKITMGNAWPGKTSAEETISEVDTSEINNYVRMRAGEIAANVAAQAGFAGMTVKDLPCGIILVGGGANLRGFVELLGSETGLPVRRGTTPPSVRVVGAKLNPAQDLDIVAVMNSLVGEPLKECVKENEPERQPEPDVKNSHNNVPSSEPVGEDSDDWSDDEDETDEKAKKDNWLKQVFKTFKKSVAPLDETDDEEFN
ncbi:MAG: cell division protein FtsA [Muribaculaceae bacterium]|nr:cell division protein FtsA [Muribaculaceae bacterium]